ncbi:MAG TPA: YceI family protein [Gemmatimonadaceae bacterium]|jgi:polyisoprenoid-binding protein YceI
MTTALEPITATATTWLLDTSHTNVEFAVKHLMIATVKGRFADVTGKLTGSFDDPSNFQLEVNIATESVDTRQAQRDAHLRSSDFFDAGKWPAITFTGKRIVGDTSNEFTLIGDITIRDVTREIALDVANEGSVRDPWGNERIGFSARARLDRRDFGLLYNQALEAGGFVVGDEIKISIDAEFTAA